MCGAHTCLLLRRQRLRHSCPGHGKCWPACCARSARAGHGGVQAKQVVQITAESGESEAFFDGAAAHLHDADGALYLALPVVRDAASQSTEEELGCRLRSGGRFGGAFVWALLSDDRIEGDKIATPLAAVPDTCAAPPAVLALSSRGRQVPCQFTAASLL